MLMQFTPLYPFINNNEILECRPYSKQRNWSQQQLYKLACFLQFHSDKFDNQKIKKESKIYAIMSRYINTRNSSQCRSYVVKLFHKFRIIQNILRFFRESLPFIQIKYQQEAEILKKIIFPPKIAGEDMKIKYLNLKDTLFDYQIIQKTQNQLKQTQKQLLPTNTNYYQEEDSIISILKQKHNISHQIYNFQKKKIDEKQDEWKQCQRRLVKWIDKTVNTIENYKKREIIL